MTRRALALSLVLLAGCGEAVPAGEAGSASESSPGATSASDPSEEGTPTPDPSGTGASTPEALERGAPSPEPDGRVRPEWLGTRVLPTRPDGYGEVRPTPPELRDRRFPTIDLLPPPADDAFHGAVSEVPREVAERSTWAPDCPVGLDDLRYLRLTFWGFDDEAHTGEMIVHASVAEDVVGVFRRLHELRFPIEEMRVVDAPELDAPPTGDGNNTTSFVCRPAVGSGSWSEHASGLAVDVNPFHNPYVRGDLVLPELASAYADREWRRPGMVTSEVVEAFARVGWGWGGDWTSPVDPMHFSASGR